MFKESLNGGQLILTNDDSPAGLIDEQSESSSMKNAGLERHNSCRGRELSCVEGGLTMGGRRGYDGTLGKLRVLPLGEDGDGDRDRR